MRKLFCGLVVCFSLGVEAATPSLEEVWAVVQKQQAEIDQLKAELAASQQMLATAKKELEVQTEAHESRIANTETALEVAVDSLESVAMTGSGSATTLGGYGELHYNNLDSGDEFDYHRFVLFVAHQFADNLSFHSELELEHSLAGDGKPGEVELEQAYIQYDYAPGHHTKMGLFLMPLGMLNETHEPETFFGVERNRIENQIIPTTWWEAGALFGGEIAPGWSYDLAVHSGLNLKGTNPSIRSARQKVAEANGDSLAYTGRVSFKGIPGFQWNASVQYQSDLTQGDDDGTGVSDIDGTLFETNISYQSGGLGLRALYARWDIDDKIQTYAVGADEQFGWYVEPSYRFESGFGVFARYGAYDLRAGDGGASDERKQWDLGVNYWLHPNVVLKADIQRQNNDNGNDVDGFNLGVGYSF